MFVNGKQELKFKAKTSHLVKEKLCIGNLSDQWTTSEAEKTGLYGNIYDFVVDYEQIVGAKTIYNNVFKTTGWLQGQLSLSSFRGR